MSIIESTPGAATLDPVTYEVINHRLWSINDEGSTTIVHASGSPVVHATDYNFALYTGDGDLAMSGVFYMPPIYTMQMFVKEVIAGYEGDINPGDVFITNDPFVAGVHQSDVQFISPFFHDGRIVAWTGCMAHVMDVGGMNPGSWCPTATDLYQEGLLIPIGRIVEEGEINRSLWDTIMYNSRLPSMVANDFSAFLSSHRVSQARLTEACERYGADAIEATMQRTLDITEQRMRAWVAELPDGDFQTASYVDHDGHANNLYRVDCTLKKRGDSLVFDFEGSSPAIRGSGNASRSATYGAVGSAILGVFGSDLPWNAGLMRAVTVDIPRNTCVSAEAPMPISAGSTTSSWVALSIAAGSLGKLLSFSEKYAGYAFGPPDGSWLLSQFGGTNQYGEPFATMIMDSLGWGGPAFRDRDGVSCGGSLGMLGGASNDVELHENHQPLLYLWRREVPDSGGAGRTRGGNGVEFALALHDTDEAVASCIAQGVVIPTGTGLFGGHPGGNALYEVVKGSDWLQDMAQGKVHADMHDLTGEYFRPPAKDTVSLTRGDVINNVDQNAGGFGDPLERDPARVATDVREGTCGEAVASDIYGVVIAGPGVADLEATEARRAQLRTVRLADLRNVRDGYESKELEVVYRWGDTLNLARQGDQIVVQCAESGVVLGPLGENWRDVAPYRVPTNEELGPRLTLDPRLEYRQYLDPVTGRCLWLDFQHLDAPLTNDFRLVDLAD
ncbi:MAG: hydantoinase B/oxoprolinase family protein [Solirubrobacterales bacterium]|nr:hydantoinase B/oxoprolinase family protein [Solirubrobacterales bacterium]